MGSATHKSALHFLSVVADHLREAEGHLLHAGGLMAITRGEEPGSVTAETIRQQTKVGDAIQRHLGTLLGDLDKAAVDLKWLAMCVIEARDGISLRELLSSLPVTSAPITGTDEPHIVTGQPRPPE